MLFLFIRGVKSNEIILSQLIIHSVILVIQIVIVLFTALYLFQVNLFLSLETDRQPMSLHFSFPLDSVPRKFSLFFTALLIPRVLWNDLR